MKKKLRIAINVITALAVFFSMTAFAFGAESQIKVPVKNKGTESALGQVLNLV